MKKGIIALSLLSFAILSMANAQPPSRGYLFYDNFADAINFRNFWTNVSGTWIPQSGLRNGGMDEEILVTNQDFGNFFLQANISLLSGQGFGLIFRYQSPSAYYMFRPHYSDQAQLWLRTPLGGWTLLASAPSPLPTPGEYHIYSVSANGSRLIAMRDGVPILNVTDSSIPSGRIGFRTVDTKIDCKWVGIFFIAPAPSTLTLTSTITKPTTVTSTSTIVFTSYATSNVTVIAYRTSTSFSPTITVLGTSTSYIATTNLTTTGFHTVYSLTTVPTTSHSPTITITTTQTYVVPTYSYYTYTVNVYTATSTEWSTTTLSTTVWTAPTTTSMTITFFMTEYATATSTYSAIVTTYQWVYQTMTSTLLKYVDIPGIGPLRAEYAFGILGAIGGAGLVYYYTTRRERTEEEETRPRRRKGRAETGGQALRELLERFRRREEGEGQ
ncbi:MAG: hypothetical protein QXQ76_00320 [Candidatus Bathyarchaeia archaeon]